jgi:UPF0042 nucleotide-binding protein
MDIFIISGLSGGGKSRVAAALEDLDFYCVDNMPVSMMSKFAELCVATHGRYERVAMVTDVRALKDIDEFFETLEDIRKMGINLSILFVEAEIETIVKRYKETRRRHPLIASDSSLQNLQDAVRKEVLFLAPLRNMADEIIDTTGLTLNKLQHRLVKKFMEGQEYKALNINVKSFGFKHGLPIEADLIFDVRFMPNPHYENDLRNKTGLDADVRDFVFAHPQSEGFFTRLCEMMDFLLPHYMEEGKRYLIVCIGCTGGKHRAVAISHALAEHLTAGGYPVDCIHRDIDKE